MYNTALIGILGLVAIAACWGLAVVLFRVGPRGSTARLLAWLLVIEGITLITAGFPEFALDLGPDFYEKHVALDIAGFVLHHLGDAGMLMFYPPFLALVLVTPMTRPFARKGVRISLVVIGLAMVATSVAWMALKESMFGVGIIYASLMVLFLFGLIASLDAWYRAESGISKTRAGLFAVAFGIRDVCWGFVYGASFYMAATGTFSPEVALFWQVKIIYALGTLLAVPLIAYGILRAHLFDIDLKVRWTLKQSTFAASVVVITFVVSEGIEMLVAAELGDTWGLVAAGVAVVLLKPLQAFAERVVSLLMPHTRNTDEYKDSRKLEVYEAAFSDAQVDGNVSDRERALLNHLRDSLGLSEDRTRTIEAMAISASEFKREQS